MAVALLPAPKHTTINNHNMQVKGISSKNYNKLSLFMFIGPFRSWLVDELSCLILTSHVDRTTDTEHHWWLQWHIYVVYVPPQGWWDYFAMLAMFGASAAEVRGLLISGCNLGGAWDGMFASQALSHLFLPRFLHLIWVGISLGKLFICLQYQLKVLRTA